MRCVQLVPGGGPPQRPARRLPRGVALRRARPPSGPARRPQPGRRALCRHNLGEGAHLVARGVTKRGGSAGASAPRREHVSQSECSVCTSRCTKRRCAVLHVTWESGTNRCCAASSRSAVLIQRLVI